MKRRSSSKLTRHALTGVCLALAAACSGGAPGNPSPSAIANASPDARGVITYATYQVALAREGDTVVSLADRVGTTPAELSQRNGLPADYRMRAGEVVVLPDSAPRLGPGQTSGWSPDIAAAAIEQAPLAAVPTAPPPSNPFGNGQTEPLIDPVRHRVETGETVYSIARLYGVSVTALASWNGLGPDLTVRENQELLIPIVSEANQITSTLDTQPGEGTAVTPPPIAATPLPENLAPGEDPASPNLGQFRTPPGGRLNPPVDGAIARGYDAAQPNGVGFAATAGAPVRAAGAGEVALISQESGSGGSIVLIRHADDLMTTYSLLSGVTLEKGDRVRAGDVIGAVAGERSEVQFDVFRGLDPVDPTIYLGG